MTDKAKTEATMADRDTSAKTYQDAYALFMSEDAAGRVGDAKVSFPIISGIMLALKWKTIRDDNGNYELR